MKVAIEREQSQACLGYAERKRLRYKVSKLNIEKLKQNNTLNEIIELVLARQLGKSIEALENYLLTHPQQADMDALISLRDDYRLMADYWQRGFSDPQREQVYDQLLRRMYVLTANMISNWQLTDSPFMKNLHLRPRKNRKDWSMSSVRAAMEDFVGSVAMLQLEKNGNSSKELHQQHWQLMNDLFDYIVTSRQWRQQLADIFLDMLLSPTLSSIDQQMVVSAIMLSALQTFCPQKFRVLAEVYRQSTDERVRQRALVGWVFAACCSDSRAWRLFTDVGDTIASLCEDEQTRSELAELQMQLIYCTEADADTHTIQKEILPDIMNGSNIKMTRQGLVEMDEDGLDDILHPEAAEENMERMEKSMHRMVDMQRQGADIYFGGFSQMKRFAFFSQLSNWFVPFYSQHPDISEIWNNTRGKKFLKAITRMGAFCDSDKYSFVLAFNQVLDRLPQSMLKLIEEGEATAIPMGGEVSEEQQEAPPFMRRLYLQDIYRFYRLFTTRSEFFNPFAYTVFFSHPLLAVPALSSQSLSVARFLLKRHRYAEAVSVLANISEQQRDFQYYMMMGTALQHEPLTSQPTPLSCYRQALQLQPDNERAKAALARALFASQEYEEALEHYNALLEQQPEHRSYQLNAAVCLINLQRSDEALKMLYKLNYLYPDDLSVNRVLAWALTLSGKYEQAEKLFSQLLTEEKPQPADMLNYGYCLWLSGNIEKAIGMFRQFIETQGDDGIDIEKEFMHGSEHELLLQHGITDTDIRLMLDAI